MISNNDVQSAIITFMKGNANILAVLSDSDEIREDQWQGTGFSYPNYRIKLDDLVPSTENNCTRLEALFTILCNSEEKSSKEANTMAGILVNELHRNSFTRDGVRFSSVITQRNIPAESIGGIWQSQVMLKAIVS